ncbi:hypothetical protein BDR03DRAFT_971213 [Suillus americanus]|nr:hypothetical protein BDR03DRAFT_971213 [Suillus americanus]
MRVSFIFAVVAAFKLTASMPAVLECPSFCNVDADCCPGETCNVVAVDMFPVSMSSFLLTLWLTGMVDNLLRLAMTH